MTDDALLLDCQTFLTLHPMGEPIEADLNAESEQMSVFCQDAPHLL